MHALPAPLMAAVNHLLRQASWTRSKLAPFAGHTAEIRMPPFEAAFTIVESGQIIPPAAKARSEVTITLPLTAPLLLMQGPDAVMRAARLEGSTEFAEALAFVIRNLRWDVEEDLSKLFGDIVAHRLVGGTKGFGSWQQQAAKNLAENLAEYFTEEQPLIARRSDIAEFSNGIDRLRDDLARLDKRIARLGH